MDVAKGAGIETLCLSTGGRSEGYLQRLRPDLPETAFIQVADFFAFSLKEVSRRGFEKVLFACFFGKLVKMAQGQTYTHAKDSRIDFQRLSEWCEPFGLSSENLKGIAGANTAREALGIIQAVPRGGEILGHVAMHALRHARVFAGPQPRLVFYLFDMDGVLLCKKESDQ
jgi:cobalt-precorrin-5B (C1)-methyltransferase